MRLGNYRIFLLSNSALALALGLFTPFYIVFIQEFGGGIEQFGFAIGLMVLAQSVTSYFTGKYSDRFGRKIFLITGGFAMSGVVLGYAFISTLIELYILQILNGVTNAMQMTMETSFLGDITEKLSRGTDIGKYHAAVGIMTALAMMAGGFVIGELGFKVIFYFTAAIIFLSTLILFRIKE